MPTKKKRKSISEERKKSKPDFEFPAEAIPSNIPDVPAPGQALLTVLKTNDVNEKQFLGMKLPDKVFEQLTMQEIRDLKVVFEAFDLDNSGTIDIKELHRAMKILGFRVSRNEVREMMADVDTRNQGEIAFAEFLLFIIERQSDSRDIYEEVRHGFKTFVDSEDDGSITAASLKRVCREAGVKFTDKEISDMMEVADINGDEVVDEDEFLAIMLKTNLF